MPPLLPVSVEQKQRKNPENSKKRWKLWDEAERRSIRHFEFISSCGFFLNRSVLCSDWLLAVTHDTKIVPRFSFCTFWAIWICFFFLFFKPAGRLRCSLTFQSSLLPLDWKASRCFCSFQIHSCCRRTRWNEPSWSPDMLGWSSQFRGSMERVLRGWIRDPG